MLRRGVPLGAPPPSPLRRPQRRAPTSRVGRANVRPSSKASASGRGVGRVPKRDDKLVTSEATTTPDGGDSSAEEGARGRASEAPASGPRRAPGGNEAICMSSASEPRNEGEGGVRGVEGGSASLLEQGHTRASGGPNPHRCGVPQGRGDGLMWLLPGVCVGRGRRVRRWEWQLGGREEDVPAGALFVASRVRQGRGFRVEGKARSDPGWPALVRCLAELARVAMWLAPRTRVDLLRLLGRCTVLAERVFAAAEDWGRGR